MLKNFMKSIFIKNRIKDVNWLQNGKYVLFMEGFNTKGGLIFYNLNEYILLWN